MKILFCSEFYYPSVGGVQEVMRQLAERLVERGHEVVVATTRLPNRVADVHNGVRIEGFSVQGNLVRGIEGEADRFRDFVVGFDGDAIMIKAAQQWTFDALWPVLDDIKMRKVLIPCGFSGLFEPAYAGYFEQLPDILRKFDHLIFYAERYRDVDFARSHGITNFTVLPNGASEREFDVPVDPEFRKRHGIGEDDFVFLTVGSMNGMKGHSEVARAFSEMDTGGRKATLILNGNAPPAPIFKSRPVVVKENGPPRIPLTTRIAGFVDRKYKEFVFLIERAIGVAQREGFAGITERIVTRLAKRFEKVAPVAVRVLQIDPRTLPMEHWLTKIREQPATKTVMVTDFGREELVQAFMTANLFVFASNIEYSPLVLYETVAAGTPFLSVPVGNAEEIARWTEGGEIIPADKDERGYTWVNPSDLALEMTRDMGRRQELAQRGEAARLIWKVRFTWSRISQQYEHILSGQPE